MTREGTSGALEIVDVGWGTTIQDRGRPGLAAIGVPTAGAVDPPLHALANRLVGNPEERACFETVGGLVVRARQPLVVAETSSGRLVTLAPGERLTVERSADRTWSYLAVRGGMNVDRVLGSASHDTLSGLGPPPVRSGVSYAVGPDPGSELLVDLAPPRPLGALVAVWPGPQVDRFTAGLGALTDRPWTVADEVSRVGARLLAQPFDRDPHAAGTMPSAGLVLGAIQITPSGEPIVMLSNHPTTGGYPVIGVVDPTDLPIVAQSAPGAVLRFRPR